MPTRARLAGVAALLALTSCSGPLSSGPELDRDLRPSGTALASGLSVLDGSALLGAMLVHEVDQADEPSIWTAYLVVDRSPLRVWDAYLAEFSRLGLSKQRKLLPGMGCGRYPSGLSCHNELKFGGRSSGSSLGLVLGPLPDDRDGRWLVTLSARGLRDDESGPAGRWSERRRYEHAPTGDGPPAIAPLPAPTVGARLGPRTTVPTEIFTLVDGSRQVARIGPGGTGGAFEVMLAVEAGADPTLVADRYQEQCERALGGDVVRDEVLRYRDVTQHVVVRNSSGRGTCTVATVRRPDQPTYVFLQRWTTGGSRQRRRTNGGDLDRRSA